MNCPIDHERTIEYKDRSMMWVTDQSYPPYRLIKLRYCPNCGTDMTADSEMMNDDALMDIFGNIQAQLDRLRIRE